MGSLFFIEGLRKQRKKLREERKREKKREKREFEERKNRKERLMRVLLKNERIRRENQREYWNNHINSYFLLFPQVLKQRDIISTQTPIYDTFFTVHFHNET